MSEFNRGLSCFLLTVGLLCALGQQAPAGPSTDATAEDPFEQHVPVLSLSDQTVVDGIAKLSQATNIAVAVEFPLGRSISSPSVPLKTFHATIGPGTFAEDLDRLCDIDSTFEWKRIGNTAHLLPRALDNIQTYLLNEKIDIVTFENVPDAQKAVFNAVAQLSGPRQQLAVMQTGISLNFSHPWTASFRDITVREAFDKIAQQLGPTYGWQFGGADDFRIITFHQKLAVKPHSKKPRSFEQ